jgi:hypothetical protein
MLCILYLIKLYAAELSFYFNRIVKKSGYNYIFNNVQVLNNRLTTFYTVDFFELANSELK